MALFAGQWLNGGLINFWSVNIWHVIPSASSRQKRITSECSCKLNQWRAKSWWNLRNRQHSCQVHGDSGIRNSDEFERGTIYLRQWHFSATASRALTWVTGIYLGAWMRVTESSGSLKVIKSLPSRLAREHLDHRHSAGMLYSSAKLLQPSCRFLVTPKQMTIMVTSFSSCHGFFFFLK